MREFMIAVPPLTLSDDRRGRNIQAGEQAPRAGELLVLPMTHLFADHSFTAP
jgi:hypothetical protein